MTKYNIADPYINDADKDIELIRKAIKYIGYANIVRNLTTLNLIAAAWSVSVSEACELLEKMYDNVRSFNYEPYMNSIITDYEAFISGVSTDSKTIMIKRFYQYDWSDFRAKDVNMQQLSKKRKPLYVDVSSRKSRIKLYFEHRFIEKALLRFSMGEMRSSELQVTKMLVEAFLLIVPNPFGK